MKRMGFIMDFKKEEVTVSSTGETFKLERSRNNHLALPLNLNVLDDEALIMEDCTEKESEKKVKKVHKVMCHPSFKTMSKFFQDSSGNRKEIMKIVKEVSNSCEVCKRFKKSPLRPKVGLPMSRDFNQCVSLDIKGPIKNKTYILYIIDTFSRLTRGVIIKDKLPKTIVKSVHSSWVLGNQIGPGMPEKFLFNNRGEFNNNEMVDLAEKFALPLSAVTAANAPFSNGLCEKNHAIVDSIMAKLLADDLTIKEQEAFDYYLHAKNMATTNEGFSQKKIKKC